VEKIAKKTRFKRSAFVYRFWVYDLDDIEDADADGRGDSKSDRVVVVGW